MELKNEFQVENSFEDVWDIFAQVERVAVCLPGAQLLEVNGAEYTGMVKIKVGPITSQYKGVATMVEQDKDAKKLVLKAEGRDSKGAGNASAIINIDLEDLGDRTKVSVLTDLSVTGKVAQFGRGVMADISSKLMEQFADNLQKELTTGGQTSSVDSEEVEAVDILEASSSKSVKVIGNIAGSAVKAGRGVKGAFKKKSSEPDEEK